MFLNFPVLPLMFFPKYLPFLSLWILASLMIFFFFTFQMKPVRTIHGSRNTFVQPHVHSLCSHVLRLHCKQEQSGKRSQDSGAVNVWYRDKNIAKEVKVHLWRRLMIPTDWAWITERKEGEKKQKIGSFFPSTREWEQQNQAGKSCYS